VLRVVVGLGEELPELAPRLVVEPLVLARPQVPATQRAEQIEPDGVEDLRVGIRRLAPDATPEQTQEAIRAAVRESLLWWNGAAGVYVRSGVVAG
jgi:hypothetical protein